MAHSLPPGRRRITLRTLRVQALSPSKMKCASTTSTSDLRRARCDSLHPRREFPEVVGPIKRSSQSAIFQRNGTSAAYLPNLQIRVVMVDLDLLECQFLLNRVFQAANVGTQFNRNQKSLFDLVTLYPA